MASEGSYERKVSEAFGYCSDAVMERALASRKDYQCPFLNTKCVKPSQHRDYDASVPFGACSVWHRGKAVSTPNPYIICPVRFLQEQRIFHDASRLLARQSGTQVMVVPEISMPMGRIDYILSQYHLGTHQVLDFIVLEVMACSTTYTGDVLRSLHDILAGRQSEQRLRYGINFRQVLSRMMIQVLAKAYACQKWKKRMVWAIQDVLYEYIDSTTKADMKALEVGELGEVFPDLPCYFFVYGMERSGDMFELKLSKVYTGGIESFARVFEPKKIPEATWLVDLLESKIRQNESQFVLSPSLTYHLASVGASMVRDKDD